VKLELKVPIRQLASQIVSGQWPLLSQEELLELIERILLETDDFDFQLRAVQSLFDRFIDGQVPTNIQEPT
jgi:hypothetical protein